MCLFTRHGFAEAFLDALSVERAKWEGSTPFTCIGMGAEMKNLYLLQNQGAFWRKVRRASSHWRMRDKIILDIVGKSMSPPHLALLFTLILTAAAPLAEASPVKPVAFDLSETCTNIIICDSVDGRKNQIEQKIPFVNYQTELVRHLSSALPSIAIETGHSVVWGE